MFYHFQYGGQLVAVPEEKVTAITGVDDHNTHVATEKETYRLNVPFDVLLGNILAGKGRPVIEIDKMPVKEKK